MVDRRLMARRVLIGSDHSWSARFLCGPVGIASLALVSIALHALDLATGVRMMLLYGIAQEQNPIARSIFQLTGPIGLGAVKFAVVFCGVSFMVGMARAGRPRLARNALLAVAILGLLGFSSNLI